MMGYYNGYYYSSTYSDYGYKLSVQVGSNSAVRVDCLNGTTSNGVTVQPSVEQQGDLARVCYTVTNTNDVDVTISMGVHADVMIGYNDGAPIARRIDTLGQPYGLTMMDGNGAQLCVLFGSGLAGVTAVSDFWFGHWSDNSEPSNMVGNYYTAGNWMIENGSYDSGMGWCWKDRIIPTGSTVIFSYLIGVGEVNLEPSSSFEVTPEDPDGWNDLSRPHRLTLEGSYESPAGLDGRIEYAVEDNEEWTALTEMLPSGSTFSGDIVAMFDATKAIHVIRFRTVDNVGNTSMLPPIEYKDVSFYIVSGIENKTYTGTELFQENLTCELDADLYVVKNYSNNINVGTASFSVEGVFPKTIGRKTYTFTINPQPLSGDLVLEETDFVYNGSPFTPSWQFSNEDYAGLTAGEDFTAEWSNNQLPGTGTLTVTGKKNFTGTLTASITIEKAPLSIELLGLSLPAEELIYDELSHPAQTNPAEGVGTVSITYLMESAGMTTPQPPTLPGTYQILVSVAEGDLYYGMEQTQVGTVTISLFDTEQYALIGQMATDQKTYHMYLGTRMKLAQFLRDTQTALEGGDLATIRQAFLPQEALLAEAEASIQDYERLAGYITYTQQLQDAYGTMFTDEIKEKVASTISDMQTAYNYGAMTGEQIDQVWPQLQETVREELTKFLTPYIQSAEVLMARGLVLEIHGQMVEVLNEVQDVLTWEEYLIEDADKIKVLLRTVLTVAAAAQANVQDLAVLRQAYTAMGGAERLAEVWQFETVPYVLQGVAIVAGRITGISLPGCGITGGIPAPFFLLPQLQTLDLSNNQLSGSIDAWADEFQDKYTACNSLQTLNLSGNNLSGNVGLLPLICPNLTTLNVQGNAFEAMYPLLPATLTTAYVGNQTIGGTWKFDLFSTATSLAQLPSILLYNHSTHAITDDLRLNCVGEGWTMTLTYNGSEFYVSTASGAYHGQSGDTFTVTTTQGAAAGTTFVMSFLFDDGDANFSGYTDLFDLQTMLNYMFGEREAAFNFTAADLYTDQRINVQDVVLVVDEILNEEEEEGQEVKQVSRARNNNNVCSDATLFWRDGSLVLSTNVPVAAADFRFEGHGSLTWQLAQMGFTVSERVTERGSRVVIYSLTGAEFPIGETIIATARPGSMTLNDAILSDKEAKAISACVGASEIETGIAQRVTVDSTWTIITADGHVLRTGYGLSDFLTAQKRLTPGIYLLQTAKGNHKYTVK